MSIGTQIHKILSPNDYYYFRCPKSRMLIRITWKRGDDACCSMNADFVLNEKAVGNKWRKFQSEEARFRNDEIDPLDMAVNDAVILRQKLDAMTISELLDEVIKKQPAAQCKFKLTAEIIDFEQYLKETLINNSFEGDYENTSEKRA